MLTHSVIKHYNNNILDTGRHVVYCVLLPVNVNNINNVN